MTTDEIRCPKCGSNQLTANKNGFSGKKAIAGAVLTGGIGLLAGTIGSKKIVITCLGCGYQFKPGEGLGSPKDNIKKQQEEYAAAHPPPTWFIVVFSVVIVGFFIWLFRSCIF